MQSPPPPFFIFCIGDFFFPDLLLSVKNSFAAICWKENLYRFFDGADVWFVIGGRLREYSDKYVFTVS